MKCRRTWYIIRSGLFAKIKQSSVAEVHLSMEILTCDTLLCSLKYPRLVISNQMGKWLKVRDEHTTMGCFIVVKYLFIITFFNI